MNRPDIESIKERLKRATKGPWSVHTNVHHDLNGKLWGWISASDHSRVMCWDSHIRSDDVHFIGHAPTDLQACLDYIGELEEEIAFKKKWPTFVSWCEEYNRLAIEAGIKYHSTPDYGWYEEFKEPADLLLIKLEDFPEEPK